MKCPKCGMEMLREREGKWICRNPRCPDKDKRGEGK